MGVLQMATFGGLDRTLKYFEFELDSLDASQAFTIGSSSTDWPLFKIGGKRPLQNIAAVKVLEVQIPFTWYVFNSSNNTFMLAENGGAPVVVTLPVGNFTIAQLQTNLADALTSVSPTSWTYSVSYDASLQKITIWNNVTPDVGNSFSFIFGNSTSTGNRSPRLLIGFTAGQTDSQGFITGTSPYQGTFMTAPNCMSITGPNYLYLNSQKIGNLTNLYLPGGAVNLGQGNGGPQLAKIPINVQPGGVIYWSDPDPIKYFDMENLNALTEVDFYLTLGNTTAQTPLELNGQNFSLKFALLENEFTKSENSSGGILNNRVVKRIRKT